MNSQWVEDEVERALQIERKELRTMLLPIRLDDSILSAESGWAATIVNSRNIGDFTLWRSPEAYERSLSRLLRDLEQVSDN